MRIISVYENFQGWIAEKSEATDHANLQLKKTDFSINCKFCYCKTNEKKIGNKQQNCRFVSEPLAFLFEFVTAAVLKNATNKYK